MGEGAEAAARLSCLAHALGAPARGVIARRLEQYVHLLLEWEPRAGLTGARTADEVLDVHVRDALMAVPLLAAQGDAIDLGSGGGFPAIPIAICVPGLRWTLVESRRKKANFLRHVSREIGLGLRILECRAERLDKEPGAGGGHDVVTSRATWSLGQLLRIGGGLVRSGGVLVAFKGRAARREAEDCACEAAALGFGGAELLPYVVPSRAERPRLVVAYRKRFT